MLALHTGLGRITAQPEVISHRDRIGPDKWDHRQLGFGVSHIPISGLLEHNPAIEKSTRPDCVGQAARELRGTLQIKPLSGELRCHQPHRS